MTKPNSPHAARQYHRKGVFRRQVSMPKPPITGEPDYCKIVLKELGDEIRNATGLRVDIHPDTVGRKIIVARGNYRCHFRVSITGSTVRVVQLKVYINGEAVSNNPLNFLKPGKPLLKAGLELDAEFDLNAPDSIDKLREWMMTRVNTYVIDPHVTA